MHRHKSYADTGDAMKSGQHGCVSEVKEARNKQLLDGIEYG